MDPLIARLGLALAIGLLVGLERGWREREAPEHSRTAGIRTYGIAGLLGGVFAAIAEALSSMSVLVAGFIGFSAIFAWFKYHEAEHDEDYSVTGVIAALAVFALGALAVVGDYVAAAAGGAALAGILASREVLHGLLKRMTWVELRSALILASMTAIVLPMLPNRAVDPWGGLNPWEIWFFTVLMAAISYLGDVAVRLLGESRGLTVSALAGALLSSTAVTVALARMAKGAANPVALAGAASLAAMISLMRALLVTAIVQPSVLAAVALPALGGAAVFGCAGLLSLLRGGHGKSADPSGNARNPFDLLALLGFAAVFAVVSTLSAILARQYGTGGVVATAAFSGAFDIDVATLSALRLVSQSVIDAGTAGQAVMTALAVNAVMRSVLAMLAGPLRFSLTLLAITSAALACGVAVYVYSG
ncbi:MAG TPA: MgtC/SapB family protein [Rhizobiaceae bacterium]|nr:MgtC/SapB family protein [Rhizobiaceae bacterium]